MKDATPARRDAELRTVARRKFNFLPIVYDALGRSAEADAALAELSAQQAQSHPEDIATVYAARGDADSAFEWLEKAAQSRGADLGAIPVFPLFAPLHSDARWLPLLSRLGMAPEQLAAIPFDVKLSQQ